MLFALVKGALVLNNFVRFVSWSVDWDKQTLKKEEEKINKQDGHLEYLCN